MNKQPRFNILFTLLVLGFIIVITQVMPAFGTQAFTASPISTPSTFGSPLPTPVLCPSSTNQADLTIETTIDGLAEQDVAELQLFPDTSQTANCLATRGIDLPKLSVRNETRRITVTNIPNGSYKLVMRAPAIYFREPQGYLFRVFNGQVIRTSNLPLHFKLIPFTAQELPPCRDFSKELFPQQYVSPNEIAAKECMAERIIDISGPGKAPMTTLQWVPTAGTYFYAHVYNASTNWGIWGRMSVLKFRVPNELNPS
jgi:hypothetical protein